LRYCIGQENGGIIADCASWPDRRWQQICRVIKKETLAVCELWKWDASNLIVWAYPMDKQGQVQRLRGIGSVSSPAKIAAAKANGSLGGRPTNNPTETQHDNPTITQQETHGKPIEGNGRGRERKSKGREASPASQGQSEHNSASLSRPTHPDEAAGYFVAQGSTDEQGRTFFDHFEANGWRQGGKTAMKDWRAAARNWIRRSESAARGAAAGLGGGVANRKNNFGAAGGAARTEEFVKLPIVGIDIGADEVAALEAGKGGAA
jgi:hypothetical protein